MKYFIGTSGYNYSWWNNFYPPHISQKEYLTYYSKFFDSVEINYTFYKLPSKKVVKSWYNSVPKNFQFTIKVNSFITHYKKLKDVRPYLNKFLKRLAPLKEKLKCLLFTFPKNFVYNDINLKRLIKVKLLLSDFTHIRVAVEFRSTTWFNTYIKELGSFIIVIGYYYDIGFVPNLPKLPKFYNNKKIYIRMHGYDSTYGGSYPKRVLQKIVDHINKYGIKECFIYFNNTDTINKNGQVDAVLDALKMKSIINL